MESPESQLIAAAFSAVFERPVVTREEYERRKFEPRFKRVEMLDVQKLAVLSYEPVTGKFGDKFGESGRKITVYLQSLTGRVIRLEIGINSYVEEVKHLLEEKQGITDHNDGLKLVYTGRQYRYESVSEMLKDLLVMVFKPSRVMENGHRVSEYGVQDGDIIDFIVALRASGPNIPFVLDDDLRHPAYDYDFSSKTDDGTVFMRGDRKYYRPYGWKRYALKVHGKYEDDTWLGKEGYRTYSSPGEWPVSYHGTRCDSANSIARVGYLVSKRRLGRELFGKGIYSSPSIDVAAGFAVSFEHDNSYYKVVFQNRVSTTSLEEYNPPNGVYWLQKDEKLVRPYGICIKKT